MKVLIKIGVFSLLFVVFLAWLFPYASLVERAVRQAETATGATILYKPGAVGIRGVKVSDLSIRMASGAFLQFDSARIFPTTNGLVATAFQGEKEMRINFNGTVLELELDGINLQTGTTAIGAARATGDVVYNVRTREGKGSLRLVIPELGLPIPLPDRSAEIGSTFVIKNIGSPEMPLTGVSTEIKLLSTDGTASANGTVSLEGQPPPSPPLLNGTMRYEVPLSRGTLRLSGTWDKPVTNIIPN